MPLLHAPSPLKTPNLLLYARVLFLLNFVCARLILICGHPILAICAHPLPVPQIVCFSKLSHDLITRPVKGVPPEAALPNPSRGRALRGVRSAAGQQGVCFARPGCRSALVSARTQIPYVLILLLIMAADSPSDGWHIFKFIVSRAFNRRRWISSRLVVSTQERRRTPQRLIWLEADGYGGGGLLFGPHFQGPRATHSP